MDETARLLERITAVCNPGWKSTDVDKSACLCDTCMRIRYVHFCWQPTSQVQNYSRVITHQSDRIGHPVSVYAGTEWLPWLDGLLVSSSSVQTLSHVQLFVTSWIAALQASLSITNSWNLLNSCPLGPWCHPTTSSSVIPFSSCLQSSPASGSFPISQFFTSVGQSTGVSASVSDLPMNIQGWFSLG